MAVAAPANSRSVAWVVVLAVGVAGAIVAALLPAGGAPAAAILVAADVASLIAIAWRLRSTPPRPALPWVVFGVGLALVAVTDTAAALMGEPIRSASSQPALGLLYVAAFAMLTIGIALAAWSRRVGWDPGEIVDALIVAAVAGIVVFVLVFGVPVAAGAGTSARVTTLLVVLLDVLMLGAGTLTFIRLGRPSPAVALLGAALVANFLAGTLFANGVLGQTAAPSEGALPLAILSSVCLAAAVLHPAIADLVRARRGVAPLSPRLRLALLTAAALLSAVAALAGQILGEEAAIDIATDVLVLIAVSLFAIRAWILATTAARTESTLERTKMDLSERNELVAAISEAMPGVLFAGDLATLTLDYASPGLSTLLGVDTASALGTPGWIVERLHPDDRAQFIALSTAAQAAGRTTQTYENRMRTVDGDYRYMASTVRYVKGSRGKLDRFVGVGIDVTDRVEAEAQVERSRALLEEILSATPAMILRGRFEPRVLDYVSPAVTSILGYRPEEIVGIEDWTSDHMHPEERESNLALVREIVARGGGEATQVIRFRAADGAYRALMLNTRVHVAPDGKAEYIASAIDVTEKEDAEARLREQERFVAQIVQTSAGVIFAGRADTDTIEFVSPSIERVLGYAPEEVVGVPGLLQELTHPEDSALRISQREAAVGRGSGRYGAVRRVRGKDGSYHSLVLATRIVTDSAGIPRYVTNALDISDRIALEGELVRARDLAEQLVATSPGIIFRGRMTPSVIDYMSPGIEQLIGYRPDEVVGVEDWVPQHIHPDDAGPQGEAMRALAAQGGGELTRILRIRAADGSYASLLVTIRLRVPADGSPEFFASAIDVSEQMQAEIRLSERDAFIADIARTSPAVILAGRVDTDTMEFVSPSVEPILGYSPEEIVGVPAFMRSLVHPDDAPVWRDERRPPTASGLVDAGEVRRIRAKDGTYRSLVFATYVNVDAGGVPRFVSSAMDISDRVKLEEELLTARDAAEEASRAKTEFLSLVSHELRTPLTAILGFGELLSRSELSDQAREDVEAIVAAGRRELRLVDRILDFVRLESGRLRPDIGPVVLADIVRQAMGRTTSLEGEHGARIVDRSQSLGDLVCSGDGPRLGSVLEGLLDNAIRHGGRGVTVTVSLARTAGGGGQVVVADDGTGMTDEQIADALSPLSRNGIGTGMALGLSLGRRLVEAMGGALEIVSVPGRGTTVSLSLPPYVEASGAAPRPAAVATATAVAGRPAADEGDRQADLSSAAGGASDGRGGAG